MWIFLPNGQVSVVQHRAFNNVLLVRSRSEAPLITLFPALIATRTEDSDYRYRVTVSKTQFASALTHWIHTELDYPNFKAAADADLQPLYHEVYNDVWRAYHQ